MLGREGGKLLEATLVLFHVLGSKSTPLLWSSIFSSLEDNLWMESCSSVGPARVSHAASE